MIVRVFVQRHKGVEIRPKTVDDPRGRLTLVQGKERFAALTEGMPIEGQPPKLLLPKLWKYEVALEGDVMTIQGVEKVDQALYYQVWRCLIQRNQQGAAWP